VKGEEKRIEVRKVTSLSVMLLITWLINCLINFLVEWSCHVELG
jgi:hypothetical protein